MNKEGGNCSLICLQGKNGKKASKNAQKGNFLLKNESKWTKKSKIVK